MLEELKLVTSLLSKIAPFGLYFDFLFLDKISKTTNEI
jgi:hypothetical protein